MHLNTSHSQHQQNCLRRSQNGLPWCREGELSSGVLYFCRSQAGLAGSSPWASPPPVLCSTTPTSTSSSWPEGALQGQQALSSDGHCYQKNVFSTGKITLIERVHFQVFQHLYIAWKKKTTGVSADVQYLLLFNEISFFSSLVHHHTQTYPSPVVCRSWSVLGTLNATLNPQHL